ncbi:MAG: hypothetical protein HY889_00465, partial [Deltaproteobacteria bacterium]|nr:hypothetical protein [Deltaproteobacteria bacterium]
MTDQRIQYLEEMVGAGHPTKADTLNRLAVVEHNNDGTHKALTQVKDPWIDVRAFGAVGDGITDDTAAIVNAIASLPASGGEIRLIPGKTHLVTCPTTATYAGGTIYTSFTMKSNLKVVGWNSIIKMANNVTTALSPKATAVFFSNQYLTNISFEGITFDMNGANNSTNSTNLFQSAILFSSDNARCDDLKIYRCSFQNSVGTSVVGLSQTNTVGALIGFRNIIRDNYFYHTNAYLTTTDHSTIGGIVNDSVFEGNTFEFSAIRSDNIGVAIDLQGTNNRFVNNRVKNYAIGVQIGGNYVTPSEDIVVANNVFSPMKNGGVNFFREVATAQAIDKITIAHNHIDLDDSATTIPEKYGVQAVTQYGLSDILIQGNTIKKTGNTVQSAGVYFTPNLAGQKYSNIVIDGNTVIGTYEGVHILGTVSDLGTVKIINNTFRNINNLAAGGASSMGVQFYLNGRTIDEVIITNNTFINDASVNFTYGVWIGTNAGAGTYGTIVSDNNTYKGITNLGPLPSLSYTESGVGSILTKRFGSDILYYAAAPTSGAWVTGQRVYNKTPT